MQSMGEHLYLPDLLPLRSLKIIPNETLIVNERSKSTPSQSLRVNLFLAVLMLMEDVGENLCWRKTCMLVKNKGLRYLGGLGRRRPEKPCPTQFPQPIVTVRILTSQCIAGIYMLALTVAVHT